MAGLIAVTATAGGAGCGLKPQVGTTVNPTASVRPITSNGVRQKIETLRGKKAVMVTIWATWCMPCVEEMPGLVRIQKTYAADLDLILVSADFPEDAPRVDSFLASVQAGSAGYIKSEPDQDFLSGFPPEWSGSLPAIWIYDRSGNKVAFWERQVSEEMIESHVRMACGFSPARP